MEKCIKSEIAQLKNYKRRTTIRDEVGPSFPIDHDCRVFLLVWSIYHNVGLNVLRDLDGKDLFIFFFLKKFVKMSYSAILHQLDDKIVDGIELIRTGRVKSIGAYGAKFISNFIFFFDGVMSVGISIYVKCSKGDSQGNYIAIQKW